jgi:hypothetical protein
VSDQTVITDRWRTPVIAQRRKDGGIVLRGYFTNIIALSDTELERIFSFAHDQGVPQRYVMAPESPERQDHTRAG